MGKGAIRSPLADLNLWRKDTASVAPLTVNGGNRCDPAFGCGTIFELTLTQ